MEEKQEDRSKQAHIKHTKDKVFNIVLRRTKGKNCQQFVQCDPCCHTLQQPQKWVGVGVLSSIWPQDLIYTTTELRTQTLLGMDLEPSDRFWTYIQYIETGARREEEGIGEVGKKDLFLFQRSCQVDLHSASEWCVMCRRAFFLLIPSTLVERIGLRDE